MVYTTSPFAVVSVLIATILVALPASAQGDTGKQILVETHMLRLDTDKVPANVKQILSQPATQPADSAYLTTEQRDQLLKAVSDTGGKVLASPSLLLLDGTQAEVRSVSSRRYVAALNPHPDAHGQPFYEPDVKDAESGITLKVKANVAKDGKYVSLHLYPRLQTLLDLTSYTYHSKTQGKKDHLSIQEPRSQDTSLETLVAVPDGETLVLGGQTIADPHHPQTLLVLVRPTILLTNARPTTRPANAIRIQTKVLSISRNFASDIGVPLPADGKSPFLDDVQAERLLRATQATVNSSVITSPHVIIGNGHEAIVRTGSPTSYVSTFTVAKDAAGTLQYQPKNDSIDDGIALQLAASAKPGQDVIDVSVKLTTNRLESLESFTFLDDNPTKLTVQEPRCKLLSASLNAAIPDKHWLVIGPLLSVEGTVERETGVPVISHIPVVKRLFTNRTVARDTVDGYLLIRPEMLDQMPR